MNDISHHSQPVPSRADGLHDFSRASASDILSVIEQSVCEVSEILISFERNEEGNGPVPAMNYLGPALGLSVRLTHGILSEGARGKTELHEESVNKAHRTLFLAESEVKDLKGKFSAGDFFYALEYLETAVTSLRHCHVELEAQNLKEAAKKLDMTLRLIDEALEFLE